MAFGKNLKNWLIRNLANRYLAVITEDDILKITRQAWFINKRQLSEEEVAVLVDEAKALKTSFLWEIVKRDIKKVATEKMGAKAKTADDVVHGNAIFYALGLLDEYLERLGKL